MDTAKQHWPILGKLGTDLANKVRSFIVIGDDGSGVMVATKDELGFWLGEMKFGSSETKIAIEPTLLNVPNELVQLAQGNNHILLLNKRGEIYSMGQNEHGELGLGTATKETHFTPQLIPSPHKFVSVRCGIGHSVALTEDGKCWAWGWNYLGQVGVPKSTRSIPSPRQIAELDPHRIVAVECGGCHSLALTDQGEVYAWGGGQYGYGELSLHIPTRIQTRSPVQSMAAGHNHTLLLTQKGKVWAYGDNPEGELGLPTTIEIISRLFKVAGLPPISQIASHPSSHVSIAMSSDQRCYYWGELGNGKIENSITIPTPIILPPFYSTVESPLSFFCHYRSTPHSIQLPETPSNRLTTQMSRMFDNPETSPDVQFVVEQRTIHAHRNILSNSSDYFARMFSERSMAPVDPEDPIARVTITDHSYQVFHSFLRFLYTDYLDVSFDILPELFDLTRHYLVPDLQQLCLQRMRETLIPATCCLYYPLTQRHSLLPELATFQQELVQFASTRMSEISVTSAYQSMEPDLCDNLTNAAQISICNSLNSLTV